MVVTAHRQMGSKARVATRLLQLVPSDVTVWVEGFAGTGAMTLAKEPHAAEHLNDLNDGVVTLFRVLRDDALRDRLCALLELTPYAQVEFETARDAIFGGTPPDDPVEHARQFLVASWQAIGAKQVRHASWRLDLGRSWLTSTWRSVPDRLIRIAQRLRTVHVHRKHIRDLVEMFDPVGPGCLLFLDPPYPRDTLATHETLYTHDMTSDEHRELAERLLTARCRVLLTMSEGTIYSDVLSDWHVTEFPVRGLRNTVKTELALTNYRLPVADLFAGAAE